jgi:hypothetical protein
MAVFNIWQAGVQDELTSLRRLRLRMRIVLRRGLHKCTIYVLNVRAALVGH